jgi:hypothetical protein
MATSKVILRDTKKAGAELSEKQFTLVKITTTDTIVSAASGDRAFVLEDNPKENEHGTIALAGIAKVKLGGTVKEGELVVPNNEGLAVAASGKAQPVVGQALAAGESGQIIPVFTPTGATA